MTQKRPSRGPGDRYPDPENQVPTIAPDEDVEPLTLKDPTLEVDHVVALRPKPKRPPKKGAGALAWVVAIVLIAGIGAVVAFVLMRDGGGGTSGAATTSEGQADAGSSASQEETAAAQAAADASEEAAAPEETQAAAATSEEVADDAAVAATDDAAAEAAEETQVATDDATSEETSAAASDATESDGSVAAADDAAAVPADDATAIAATDDATAAVATEADATVVASGDAATPAGADDAAAPAGDAAVAIVADATAPADVVVAVKIDPAESKRLNDLGYVARKAGDHATAMARYKEAVAADPENVWARYNFACELALAKQSKEALNELVAIHKLGTAEAKKALAAARKDSDFESLKDLGQFVRLTR